MLETILLQLTLELPDMTELMATANSSNEPVSDVVSRVVAAKIAADRQVVLNQTLIVDPIKSPTDSGSFVFHSNRPFGGFPNATAAAAVDQAREIVDPHDITRTLPDPQDERPD